MGVIVILTSAYLQSSGVHGLYNVVLETRKTTVPIIWHIYSPIPLPSPISWLISPRQEQNSILWGNTERRGTSRAPIIISLHVIDILLRLMLSDIPL